MTNPLAYKKNCAGCGHEIVMAICRDGRWRPFETERQAVPLPFACAWRKRHGMEETDRVPGHLIHPCADYHDRALRFAENATPTRRCLVHDETFTHVCRGCRADEIAAEETA